MKDAFTLLKALLSFGVGLSPVAGLLPIKFLIDLLNFSVIEDVSGKIVGALSQEIDRRVKKAITGDEQYQLGDFTKKEILNFIGKEEYAFGDVTKKVLEGFDENDKNTPKQNNAKAQSSQFKLSPEILHEFEEWDKATIDVEVVE